MEAGERISAARIRIDEISDARESADGELPLFSEAARWLRETGIQALQSEIAKLDRELISQPARVRLLRVQQEAAGLEVSRLTQRADAVRSVLNRRRLSEAKEAVARARAALGGPSAKFRAVRDLAQSNLDLAELLAKQAADSEGLSQLGWAAAALGVGIGFGLQEIVASFICGLILLFERPIRVGDVITIGDASGTVTRIRIRATTIRNWDRMELVVPNKELITGRLLNWTLTDAVTRMAIPVGVAYGSDVAKATDLLLEAARESELVLEDPAPSVVFDAFADSSLALQLRVFVRQLSDRLPAKTELHNAIDSKYRAAGIVIAFPQRDVHHYSEPPRNPDSDPDDNR